MDHVNNLGWTALIEAVILGDGGARHTRIVAALIKAGADGNNLCQCSQPFSPTISLKRGVLTKPGATALTRTDGANSSAMPFTRCSNAALAAP